MDNCIKGLKLIVLNNRPDFEFDKPVDIDNGCVILSTVHARVLNEFDWIELKLNQSNGFSGTRLAKVVFNETIVDDNVVYISPQLWFNLLFQTWDNLENVFWRYPLRQPDATVSV